MNTETAFQEIASSRNIYSALEIVGQQTEYQVRLDAFEFYKDVDDQAKLRMLTEKSGNVEEFLSALQATDSDLFQAVSRPQAIKMKQVPHRPVTPEAGRTNKTKSVSSKYSSLGRFLDAFVAPVQTQRRDELDELTIILNKRNANNVILCAPPGVGKTHLIESFAGSDECPHEIFLLDLPRVIAGTKYRGELESKLVTILEASIAEGFILFVDEIHTLATTRNAEGGVNLLDVLKPYLVRPDFKMIGATTPDEVHSLREDAAFSRRFTFMRLPELSEEQLQAVYVDFVRTSSLAAVLSGSYEAIIDRLNLSIPHRNYPEKLIDYLEYAESFYDTLWKPRSDVESFSSISIERFLRNMFV